MLTLTYENAFKVRPSMLSLCSQRLQRNPAPVTSSIIRLVSVNCHTKPPAKLLYWLQIHDDNPAIEQLLFTQFDKAGLGGPLPLPQRMAALQANRLPKVRQEGGHRCLG